MHPHPHLHTDAPTCRSDMITCAQLEEALTALKEVSGESKVKRIVEVLDEDHDGNINLKDIAEVSAVDKYLTFQSHDNPTHLLPR